MQIGMIGLGRMGANMVRRLARGGHKCVAFDQSAQAVQALSAEGARGAHDLAEFVARFRANEDTQAPPAPDLGDREVAVDVDIVAVAFDHVHGLFG